MDAVRFLQERKRMCAERPCVACPVYATGQGCTEDDNPELEVATVEEWSAAHPRKTRQSVFLEQYPCARIDGRSVLYACPADVYGNNVCPKKKDAAPIICYDCRREFWGQEVE